MSNNDTQPTISDKILNLTVLWALPRRTTPNHVTIFRFLLIPFVGWSLVAGFYESSFILFVIAAFSDAVDGALARTRDQVTDWGKVFDPLADKLLIGITALILIPLFLSPYLALVIIVVEAIIVISAFYKRKTQNIVIQSEMPGKIKMILQSIGLGLLFLHAIASVPLMLTIATYVLYLALFFAVVSVLSYSGI